MSKKRKKAKLRVANSWRDPVFWRNLLFYFLFFSFVGHYVEMAWVLLVNCTLGVEMVQGILANPLEPYTIYGVGAVLIILLVKPLAQRFKHGLPVTFIIATLACALLELISSIILTVRYGHNPYWDYHDRMFNLGGHICLGNALLFGLLATVFLRFIHPFAEKVFRRGNQMAINVALLVLVVMFVVYYLG